MVDQTDSNGEIILGYFNADLEYTFRVIKQYFETNYKVVITTATQNDTHFFDVMISMGCSSDYYGDQCQYCKTYILNYLLLFYNGL